MTGNKERSMEKNTEVGHEIVSGLEDTLTWIKAQFETFRNDVDITEKASGASFN